MKVPQMTRNRLFIQNIHMTITYIAQHKNTIIVSKQQYSTSPIIFGLNSIKYTYIYLHVIEYNNGRREYKIFFGRTITTI